MVKFSKFCSESLYGDTDQSYCVQMSDFLGTIRAVETVCDCEAAEILLFFAR